MIFGSVCSGIEAASVAWHPLGWRAAFVSEIDKFPCAVLAHHYPRVANFGDMTRFKDWPDVSIDVLVGGTPCQSFSVAGLRQGMADPRGNLALTYLAIADRFKPRWLIWENVPGVLSSNGGRDFGSIIGGMGQLGYGLAYRVLDAQHVRVDGLGRAVAQRRRRVFVVGYIGDWRPAAAVLLEPEGLRGDPAPSQKAEKGFAYDVAPSLGASGRGVERAGETRGQDPVVAVSPPLRAGGNRDTADSLIPVAFGGNNTEGPIDVATACNAHGGPAGRLDFESETFVAHSLRADGFDASEDGSGRGTPLVPVAFAQNSRDEVRMQGGDGNVVGALSAEPGMKQTTYVAAVSLRGREGGATAELGGDVSPAMRTGGGGGDKPHVLQSAVRRLTPRECERLQGFPDDYTLVNVRGKPAADGPRYKALGNSMAVNVMRWIGVRIDMVEAAMAESQEVA